jgi:hypothetical protein
MRKAFVAFSMLLLTAGAANAGGLVTRHQSSLQHTVDPTRTITSRVANSYSISGSGVSLDLDADTTGNDLKVGGFNEFSNGAVSSWHIPTATISDGEAFSFTNSVITGDATNATGTNSTVYTAGAAGSYSGDNKPGTIDSGHGLTVSGTTQGAGTSVTAQFVSEVSIFD